MLIWEKIETNAIAFSKKWKDCPGDQRQEAQTFEKDLMAVSGIQDGEDDGEPFEKKMIRLTVDLAEIFIKSHKFEDEIRERLEGNRL